MIGIQQILLDLDGPLLDGKERHYFCYRTILEKFGFESIGIDEYWEKKRAMINRRDLLNLSGAGEIYDEFLAAWLEMIESADALAFDKVQDGAIDCLGHWSERGMELILVTMRKNRRTLEDQLKTTGLRRYLDVVLMCDHADGGSGKADRVRNFYPAGKTFKCSLWVGDTEADREAAKYLDCSVVLLSNGLRNEGYLKSLPGAIVMPSIQSLNACPLKQVLTISKALGSALYHVAP